MNGPNSNNTTPSCPQGIVIMQRLQKQVAKEEIQKTLKEFKNICVSGGYGTSKSNGAPVAYNFSGQPIVYEKKQLKRLH